MSSEKYIAAIEIGSSKIIGAVGRVKDSAGTLDVIALEQMRATECVRYGVIQNVEEVGNKVATLLENLERRIGSPKRKITSVYVGLSGRSLKNVKIDISRTLGEDTEITDMIIANLREEALSHNIDSSLEVVEAHPRVFSINKQETKHPVGSFGNTISASYNLIVCRPSLRKQIHRVVRDKVGVNIAKIVVTPLAVADLVLSNEEKRLGCMLVDLGAETTTVSIYKDDNLLYLAVLPMGSRNITTDITSLKVLEEKAEEMKTSSGCAIVSEPQPTININGIKLADIVNIVAARSEEIVANIIQQITYAGITDEQLPGGIVMLGGGFNLNRFPELLKNQSGMAVRRAALPSIVNLEDTKAPAYESLELIAVLKEGMKPQAPECLEAVVVQEVPADEDYQPEADDDYEDDEPQKKSTREPRQRRGNGLWERLSKVGSGISKIFQPSEDNGDQDLD